MLSFSAVTLHLHSVRGVIFQNISEISLLIENECIKILTLVNNYRGEYIEYCEPSESENMYN